MMKENIWLASILLILILMSIALWDHKKEIERLSNDNEMIIKAASTLVKDVELNEFWLWVLRIRTGEKQ